MTTKQYREAAEKLKEFNKWSKSVRGYTDKELAAIKLISKLYSALFDFNLQVTSPKPSFKKGGISVPHLAIDDRFDETTSFAVFKNQVYLRNKN